MPNRLTRFSSDGVCISLIVAKLIPGLDGVSPPLAGIEGSTRRAFLAYDFVGSFLWTALYVGFGYLFASG